MANSLDMSNQIKRGNYIASGSLASHGYIRKCTIELKMEILIDIAKICALFCDVYLSYFIEEQRSKLIIADHDLHETHKLSCANGRWDGLDQFGRRLLMDQLLLNDAYFITEIECGGVKSFGKSGCLWLAALLKRCGHLSYIDLSDCALDNECVAVLAQSLASNASITTPICLNLSSNNIDDEGLQLLVPLFLDKLCGVHLQKTNVTQTSWSMLQKWFHQHGEIAACWFVDMHDTKIIHSDTFKQNELPVTDNVDNVLRCSSRSSNDCRCILTKPRSANMTQSQRWEGIWQSTYGPHGDEYQLLQVLHSRRNTSYVAMRKLTGDQNVPFGKITWYLDQLPTLGLVGNMAETGDSSKLSDYEQMMIEQMVVAPHIDGRLQIRGDINDVDGFEWSDCHAIALRFDRMVRHWYHSVWVDRIV